MLSRKLEVTRRSVFIRLGRFEAYAQRETVAPTHFLSQEVPGEIILDLPGFSISMVNNTRLSALRP